MGASNPGGENQEAAAPAAEAAPKSLPSHEVPVALFRQILFLPLILAQAGKAANEVISGIASALRKSGHWQPVNDPLHEGDGPLLPMEYQEFVYFHEFIQKLIHGRDSDDGAGNSGLRVFERRDCETLSIDLACDIGPDKSRAFTACLQIRRLRLHLFSSGAAVMMLELAGCGDVIIRDTGGGEKFSLAHALAIQNAVRRVYPPYFLPSEDGGLKLAEYPLAWVLSGKDGKPKPFNEAPDYFITAASGAAAVNGKTWQRANPFAPVWSNLLSPLKLAGVECVSADDKQAFRQVVDERMPSMTFISSPEARRISKGDLARLCFMDNPGEGLPYGDAFIDRTWEKHLYDRHWSASYGTRYLVSGYGFCVVGSQSPFFDYEGLVGEHFSRMYAQMGLLLHFQYAMLIAISGWISDAIDKHRNAEGALELRRDMQAIQRDFTAFVQRYRFTNVSNQLQARELYDLWQQRLGTEALYREVSEQLKDANDILDAQGQSERAEAGLRLNQLAAFGLSVALPLTFLGAVDAGKLYGRFKLEADDAKAFNCSTSPSAVMLCREDKGIETKWHEGKAKQLLAFDIGFLFLMFTLSFAAVAGISSRMNGGSHGGERVRGLLSQSAQISFLIVVIAFTANRYFAGSGP